MTADEWNAKVPEGSRVEHYPRGGPEHREAVTVGVAWNNLRGNPLVRVTNSTLKRRTSRP